MPCAITSSTSSRRLNQIFNQGETKMSRCKEVKPLKNVKYRFKFKDGYKFLLFDEYLPDGRLSFFNAVYGTVCAPMTQARFNYLMAKHAPKLIPYGQIEIDEELKRRPYLVRTSNQPTAPTTKNEPMQVASNSERPKTENNNEIKRYTIKDLTADLITRLSGLSVVEKTAFNSYARNDVEYYLSALKTDKMPFGIIAYINDVFTTLKIAL